MALQILCSQETVTKLFLLNGQFHSGSVVFEHLKCKHPLMPEISIDLNGVLKLLSNLKPDKAVGPDEIKPVVLKELRHK